MEKSNNSPVKQAVDAIADTFKKKKDKPTPKAETPPEQAQPAAQGVIRRNKSTPDIE